MHTAHSFIGRTFQHSSGTRRYFDFADIETLALLHRHDVQKRGYRAIVALMRGGAYLGAMLSQFTGLPLHVARLNRATMAVDVDVPVAPQGGKVLLTEDVAGRGYTLTTVKAALESRGWAVDVFVVAHDGLSRLKPTFGVRLNPGEQYVFPWERGVLAADFALDRTSQDPDVWALGFDLDGVFLPDIPARQYEQDLEAALAQRDALDGYPRRPQDWTSDCAIITGRLECDRARTEAWLDRNQLRPRRLLMRPDCSVEPALFKARSIAELGLTEFVESDATQAGAIAARVPYCVVWHYDGSTGVRKRVAV